MTTPNIAEVVCPVPGCKQVFKAESVALVPVDLKANADSNRANVRDHQAKTRGDLVSHIQTAHPAFGELRCTICGLITANIVPHLNSAHNPAWTP